MTSIESNKVGFVSKIGKWTNRHSALFARIPGMFSLFRLVYNVLYPVSRRDFGRNNGFRRVSSGPIEKLLVVSPQSWGRDGSTWAPAQGNYFYDIWQSAIERYGSENVNLHQVLPSDEKWQVSLLAAINRFQPSHVIMQGEENPNGDQVGLVKFAKQLRETWSGQLILVMYDSVYWWHIFNAENIAKVFPNTSVHAIDRFPHELRWVLNKSGPGVLPTSKKTMLALSASAPWKNRAPSPLPLTFVGSMYPDRQRQLENLREFGIDIVVNPHRIGRSDRPSYAEYATAIKNSWATINFSRNHGMPSKHVKTRVLEAPLFGTVLFSDERRQSSKILPTDQFVFFKNKHDLKKKIEFYSRNPQLLEDMRARGNETAALIANSIFWEVIEAAVVKD
jgi:hypothetical protein